LDLSGEFENQIRKITDNKSTEKIVKIINTAGKEYPYLTSPSNQACGTFA
jgi:hypothetical protein